MDTVVATFKENATPQLSDVKRAVEAMDLPGIEKAAHRLKDCVGDRSRRREMSGGTTGKGGQDKELSKVKPITEQLESEIARVVKAL